MGLRPTTEVLADPGVAYDHGDQPSGMFDGRSRRLTDAPGAWDGFSITLEDQVQSGLNLYLPLKNPAQARDLATVLAAHSQEAHAAVSTLRNVLFARFLMMPDGTALWVITVFDGDLDNYVMDFIPTLGHVFDAAFPFIRGAPPLPVRDHAREYLEFVDAHNMQPGVFSSMPDLPLVEVLRLANRR